MLYVRGKEVEFTFHAQGRMSERHITEEQVGKVLEKPDTERRARSKGCRRAVRPANAPVVGCFLQNEDLVQKKMVLYFDFGKLERHNP